MATYTKTFTPTLNARPSYVVDDSNISITDTLNKYFLYTGTYDDYTSQANEDTADDVHLCDNVGDFIYIGCSSQFTLIEFNVTTAGVYGAGSSITEPFYYNGSAWTATNNADGEINDFRAAEIKRCVWTTPDDEATTAVNGTTLYWIRFSTAGISSITTSPLAGRIKINITAPAPATATTILWSANF